MPPACNGYKPLCYNKLQTTHWGAIRCARPSNPFTGAPCLPNIPVISNAERRRRRLIVVNMQAEAQPERSLEPDSEQIMSLGEGRLWQVIIKLLQVFHTLHSLPFRYVSYRTTPETPNWRLVALRAWLGGLIAWDTTMNENQNENENLFPLWTLETPETLETPWHSLTRWLVVSLTPIHQRTPGQRYGGR